MKTLFFNSGYKRGRGRERLQGSTSEILLYLLMSAINNVVRFYSSPLHFQGDPDYGSYSKGAKGDKGHEGPEVSYCVTFAKILSLMMYIRNIHLEVVPTLIFSMF